MWKLNKCEENTLHSTSLAVSKTFLDSSKNWRTHLPAEGSPSFPNATPTEGALSGRSQWQWRYWADLPPAGRDQATSKLWGKKNILVCLRVLKYRCVLAHEIGLAGISLGSVSDIECRSSLYQQTAMTVIPKTTATPCSKRSAFQSTAYQGVRVWRPELFASYIRFHAQPQKYAKAG